MRALLSLCLLGSFYALNAEFQAPSSPRSTEYFSYTAPPEDNTPPVKAVRQLAAALTPPQQVVFIRTPETNLFTLTAKQLAARNALDIYVLQRQTDPETLAQQKADIEEQLARKPSVHFVKYRTPADVTRALSSLRSNYDRLPGSTSSYATQTADVFELNPNYGVQQFQQLPLLVQQQQLQVQQQQPTVQQQQPTVQQQQLPVQQQQLPVQQSQHVVFKILSRGASNYETHEQASEIEAAKLEALFRQHLPPTYRR